MLKEFLSAQLRELSEEAAARSEEYSGILGSIKGTILEYFGPNGLIASYIVLAVLILFIVSRLAKIGLSALKYLVVPAVALAAIGSFVLPYSFAMLLPVTVATCSLFLLFKG